MKTEQESDKRLLMIGSGIFQVLSGILLVCIAIAIFLSLITGESTLTKWTLAPIFLALGVTIIITSSDRHVALIKDGLSEVTDTKVVTGAQSRTDFRTDFVTGVCLDAGSHYMAAHPPSNSHYLGHFIDKLYQSVLYLEISDGSHVVLAKQLPVFKLPLAEQLLPKIGIVPLAEEARTIALFLRIPLRNLTLPDESEVFGKTDISKLIKASSTTTESSSTATAPQASVLPLPPALPATESPTATTSLIHEPNTATTAAATTEPAPGVTSATPIPAPAAIATTPEAISPAQPATPANTTVAQQPITPAENTQQVAPVVPVPTTPAQTTQPAAAAEAPLTPSPTPVAQPELPPAQDNTSQIVTSTSLSASSAAPQPASETTVAATAPSPDAASAAINFSAVAPTQPTPLATPSPSPTAAAPASTAEAPVSAPISTEPTTVHETGTISSPALDSKESEDKDSGKPRRRSDKEIEAEINAKLAALEAERALEEDEFVLPTPASS